MAKRPPQSLVFAPALSAGVMFFLEESNAEQAWDESIVAGTAGHKQSIICAGRHELKSYRHGLCFEKTRRFVGMRQRARL